MPRCRSVFYRSCDQGVDECTDLQARLCIIHRDTKIRTTMTSRTPSQSSFGERSGIWSCGKPDRPHVDSHYVHT